jgi:hypothetical protein
MVLARCSGLKARTGRVAPSSIECRIALPWCIESRLGTHASAMAAHPRSEPGAAKARDAVDHAAR